MGMLKDKRKLLAGTAIALAALALVLYIATRTPFEEQAPAVGTLAPEFHLADMSGRMIDLGEYAGKVVLINFWADWCPPCRAELEWFERVYKDYRDRGLLIVAVSVDHISIEEAMKIEASFPVAIVNERVRKSYGGVSDVPRSFLIGRDGRIIKKTGRVWPEDTLRKELEAALR